LKKAELSAVAKPVVPHKSYSRVKQVMDVPNLIDVQLNSYRWFQEEGIKELLEEISPIKDFTGNKLELWFVGYEFREPRYSETESVERDQNYSMPLYVKARLLVKATGEIKEPFDLFLGDFPIMTDHGTFITSGTERVIISQLLRSPGVYFVTTEDSVSGRQLCTANLIPSRGAWLDFETSAKDVISVKIDGKRKIPVTTLLRAIGYSSDEELYDLFRDVDTNLDHQYIKSTIDRDSSIHDTRSALLDIYRKVRPGDPPNEDNARKLITTMFFDSAHYDLGQVGRYKINRRLDIKDVSNDERTLSREDMVQIIRHIIMVNNGMDHTDDIDHLGNRRIRTVGELVQNQFRIGLMRLERVARERMSTLPIESITPSNLVNIRPVVSAVREFFSSSQLSQFMDQTNPLSELTHKRRLSAMGPGGLSRDRAGFEVRDVHYSHYGRICPIETPEGPNIGLIGSLATYGYINKFGFIETPYRQVHSTIANNDPDLVGRTLTDDVADKNGTIIARKGKPVTETQFNKIAKLSKRTINVRPYVGFKEEYMSADIEDKYYIAQANSKLNSKAEFVDDLVEARFLDQYMFLPATQCQYMDISPKQIFSVAASLIPFLEHDDANRALMGANMQRQAVPLVLPESPYVSTGMEYETARYGGQVIFAKHAGTVTSVSSSHIVVKRADNGKEDEYILKKFVRTNQSTCINQKAIVMLNQQVNAGDVLADGAATENGELALGQNVTAAFISWNGYNYEDAIIVSDRMVQEDKFTSIHITKHEIEARETKLGPEEITFDIPNVGEESRRNLDEEGIIRIGAEVNPGDILVGKITPKGETELSAEEKLLRAIFNDKAKDVKDTSLRVPHGEWGKVINVRVFTRENGDELPVRVNKWVQVWIAQKRKVSVGDKLAGRHGNKGVVSIVAPAEDMPFLPDGRPVDIVLNPLGVPSRMNLGQIMETHLGWAGSRLGFKAVTPVFDGATDVDIEDELARVWLGEQSGALKTDPFDGRSYYDEAKAKAWVEKQGFDAEKAYTKDIRGEARRICLILWLEQAGIGCRKLSDADLRAKAEEYADLNNVPTPISGKLILRDGRTGRPFDHPVTVGTKYMLKLIHLVEDKIHARATGPYSLISQQPLGGKAQFGGQRFGEMEVWSLEAYGAAHNLQEVLTTKSDDVTGRSKTYESIVKGEDIMTPGVPESFKVMVKELQSLCLSVEVISDHKPSADTVPVYSQVPEMFPQYEDKELTNNDEIVPENILNKEDEE
jgi:DNA-directed RNA polymerase subunit beta